jgi:1,4-alpha-glucan branching enzyme
VVRRDWKCLCPRKASLAREVFNSDDRKYWGTGDTNNPEVPVRPDLYEITVHLPPLGGVLLK